MFPVPVIIDSFMPVLVIAALAFSEYGPLASTNFRWSVGLISLFSSLKDPSSIRS